MFSLIYSNYNNQLDSQIANQLAKTFIAPKIRFFWEGERILSKPETAISLHFQETIVVEEDVVDLVETKSIKFRPGGRKVKVEDSLRNISR
jgi:hypothetical protein